MRQRLAINAEGVTERSPGTREESEKMRQRLAINAEGVAERSPGSVSAANATLGETNHTFSTLKALPRERRRTMAQSLVEIYVHIIFSTKDRRAFLADVQVRKDVHAYLASVFNHHDCPAVEVGGVEDHVHIVCRLGKLASISDIVRDVKRASSIRLKNREIALPSFAWQAGYGAFSLSATHVDAARDYVRNQEEHHKTETFQDEFRRICKIYGAALHERYVWE
jgi:REP element-mobilizing transposase RayT